MRMEIWMDTAMVLEATMLSFLLALGITWMSLRGLFWVLPARLAAMPVRSIENRIQQSATRNAA
jgi:hypothetical protein